MIINRRKVLLVLSLIALTTILHLSLGRMAVFFFARAHDLDVSFNKLDRVGFSAIKLTEAKVIKRGTGMGFYAQELDVKPRFKKDLAMEIEAREARFISPVADKKTRYDDISELVTMPFGSHWTYSYVRCKISLGRGIADIEEMYFFSGAIRLKVAGRFGERYSNLSAAIFFADSISGKIPEEIRKTFLASDTTGWSSLSAHIEGDIRQPSIQVTGKLFRLEIKSVMNGTER